MNKKHYPKQYHSSIALYQHLKKALKAQKTNISLSNQSQQQYKRSNASLKPISQSLNLNDIIIHNQTSNHSLQLIHNLQKPSITIPTPMTPYQQRKQIQKCANPKLTDNNKRKKIPYFQVFKGKNHHILSMKSNRQKRLNNFFTSKHQQNQQHNQQNQQNLAYSLIPKTLQQNQEQDKFYKNHQNLQNLTSNKQPTSSTNYQIFFNNSQINKNIQNIETIKKQLSSTCQKNNKMIKHFPQLQILNQNYFTQSKKNLFKRINSNNIFSSLGGHKQLIISNKNIDIKNHECKKFINEKEKLAEERQYLQEKRKNFQYFVYEYKTAGERETKLSSTSVSPSTNYKPFRQQRQSLKSATFLRSKPSFFHKSQPQSTKSANFQANNMFHNFIYKNKQAVSSSSLKSPQNRQRSMTANIRTRQRYDIKYDFGYKTGNGWKSVGIKREIGSCGIDENFVKPWQSGVQGEVGF